MKKEIETNIKNALLIIGAIVFVYYGLEQMKFLNTLLCTFLAFISLVFVNYTQ